MFVAAGADQTSVDSAGQRQGLFVAALARGLESAAVGSDGEFSAYALASYITREVEKASNGGQTPRLSGSSLDAPRTSP